MLKKILIAVIAILNLTIAGIFLYYIFVVQKKETKVQTPQNIDKQQTQENISSEIQARIDENQPNYKNYIFDFNDLDPDKLNAQLDLLTNKNIQNTENADETNILDGESEVNILDKNIPESSSSQKGTEEKPSNIDISSINKIKEAHQVENSNFVKLINAAQLKGDLTKKFLERVTNIDPNVKLCRNEYNQIVLFYGPFDDNQSRKDLLDKLLQNNLSSAFETDMTEDDFNKSCNY